MSPRPLPIASAYAPWDDAVLFDGADGVHLPGFGHREHLWAALDLQERPRLARRHKDAPGSWDPKRAQDLIECDGRRWLHGSPDGEPEPIIACSL